MFIDTAAESGHKDVVEILLKNNADLNAQDKNGNTPLYYGMFIKLNKLLL